MYEYLSWGSLDDRLHCGTSAPPLTDRQRLGCACDVTRGLAFLHGTAKIAHCDVKVSSFVLAHSMMRNFLHAHEQAYLSSSTNHSYLPSTTCMQRHSKMLLSLASHLPPDAIPPAALQAANILFDTNLVAKLGDFGLVKAVHGPEGSSTPPRALQDTMCAYTVIVGDCRTP